MGAKSPCLIERKWRHHAVWNRELWRAQYMKWPSHEIYCCFFVRKNKYEILLFGRVIPTKLQGGHISLILKLSQKSKFLGGVYFCYLKEAFENIVVNWCQFLNCVFEKRLTVRNASCLFWIQECRCAVKLSINTHSAYVILGYCFEYIRCITFGVVHSEPAHGWQLSGALTVAYSRFF